MFNPAPQQSARRPPTCRSAEATSAAGSGPGDQERPPSVVRRRARHVREPPHGAVPSAHPVLSETNVTDTGPKPGPAELDGKVDAPAGASLATSAPTTRAEHTAMDNFLIPVWTPAAPGWFLRALSPKYVLPILSNIGTYPHNTRSHVLHRAKV